MNGWWRAFTLRRRIEGWSGSGEAAVKLVFWIVSERALEDVSSTTASTGRNRRCSQERGAMCSRRPLER